MSIKVIQREAVWKHTAFCFALFCAGSGILFRIWIPGKNAPESAFLPYLCVLGVGVIVAIYPHTAFICVLRAVLLRLCPTHPFAFYTHLKSKIKGEDSLRCTATFLQMTPTNKKVAVFQQPLLRSYRTSPLLTNSFHKSLHLGQIVSPLSNPIVKLLPHK